MSRQELPIIPASAFLQKLRTVARSHQRLFPLRNVIVSGDIDVDVDTFPEGLRLRQIVFENKLTFRGCRFDDEFSMVDCSFREGFDVSSSHFASTMTIVGGAFGIPGVASDERRLILDFATFGSDVTLADLNIFGAVSGRGCRVDGSFYCAALNITAIGRIHSPFDLADARVKGILDLNALVDERIYQMTLTDAFSMAQDRPRRDKYRSTVIGYTESIDQVSVNLRMKARGGLLLRGIRCEGTIDCESGSFGAIDAALADIEGDLVVSAITAKSIAARGIRLAGSLVMISGTSGQINIDDFVHTDFRREAKVGALIMSSWTCTEWVRFGISSVGHAPDKKPSLGIRGIEITDCRIHADLDFRCGKGALRNFDGVLFREDLASTHWFGGVHTDHRVAITRTTVGGDIQLTNLRTEDVIDLTNTSAGRIRFASPLSELAHTTQSDRNHMALSYLSFFLQPQDMKPKYKERIGARAQQLVLRQVKAGDIDLTGLRLVDKNMGRGDGSVIASYASIDRELQVACRAYPIVQDNYAKDFQRRYFPAGRVIDPAQKNPLRTMIHELFTVVLQNKFADPAMSDYSKVHDYVKSTLSKRTKVATAVIPGALRLENSRIGRLRLSSETFSRDAAPAASATILKPGAGDRGIELENATVGELFIYRPLAPLSADAPCVAGGPAPKGDSDNGFPRPVNLRGLTVTSWRLEHAAEAGRGGAEIEPSESDKSDPYLDLLDNDAEYRASTYLGVEKALRDRGHDRVAREIYVAGRYRSYRTDFASSEKFKWQPGEGRLLPAYAAGKFLPRMPRLILRMKRSKDDTALAIILLVSLFLVFVTVLTNLGASISNPRLGAVLALILGLTGFLMLLFSPTALALDRLYWTFLDYGTSAWRLLVLIVGLMIVSFVLVATDPRNVEPTANASLAIKLAPRYQALCQPGHSWGTAEAFWMTLRYHIPLVNLGVMEDCQPADGPLHLRYFVDDAQPPKWWKSLIGHWPTASDWFGMMALLNYILWPLFIPFLIQRIFRRDRQS
jgi:hypothetical protein